MNLVANEKGEVIEIQGTSERKPLTRGDLDIMLQMGMGGIRDLIAYQNEVLAGGPPGA
jgi:ribonuclease PH